MQTVVSTQRSWENSMELHSIISTHIAAYNTCNPSPRESWPRGHCMLVVTHAQFFKRLRPSTQRRWVEPLGRHAQLVNKGDSICRWGAAGPAGQRKTNPLRSGQCAKALGNQRAKYGTLKVGQWSVNSIALLRSQGGCRKYSSGSFGKPGVRACHG